MVNEQSLEPLALKPRQAARLLNISQRTLWAWTQDGRIPYVVMSKGRDGRRTILYPVDDLRRWLSERAHAAADLDQKAEATRGPVDA